MAASSLVILVPVLSRPHRVDPLLASIEVSTPDARVLFLCSPGDDDEIAAVKAAGAEHVIVPWPVGPSDFSRKINYGARETTEEWIFVGADDLEFTPGWFDACLFAHKRTQACVVGTNDGGNARVISGQHSTHFLVHRDYLECGTIDTPGLLLNPEYTHEFTDDECIQTAIWRGTYVHAHQALVKHLHPDWGLAKMDATYDRGRAGREHDRALYMTRAPMWGRGRQW